MNPTIKILSEVISNWVMLGVILFIVAYGYSRKVKVYEVFVDGAKEGFTTAVMIIPYLVVILSAIAIFRASGAMDFVARNIIGFIIPERIMPADVILMSLVKPLSGGAARGVMVDIFQRFGPDSFTGFMASTIHGSTETTFYVVAVYFGSIGVKNTRLTIGAGLFADFVAVAISVFLTHLWFATSK